MHTAEGQGLLNGFWEKNKTVSRNVSPIIPFQMSLLTTVKTSDSGSSYSSDSFAVVELWVAVVAISGCQLDCI